MELSVTLTPDQKQAAAGIFEFIAKPIENANDVVAVLYSAAGCGKTFLTRVISDKLRGLFVIAGVAPTHKARKVLNKMLNSGAFLSVKTMTIASLLNKMRSHSYIGTKNYTAGANTKISNYDLFLIDEASMITDNDIDLIWNCAFQLKKKIIFIGDKYQIPNPTQRFIITGDFAQKKDSKAFDLPNRFELTTIVRQQEDNPLINTYNQIREGLIKGIEPKITRTNRICGDKGIVFFTDKDKWLTRICDVYKENKLQNTTCENIRVIAYTNDAVRNINVMIRKALGYPLMPQMGELLMGYNNVGWPEKIIENSQDYFIVGIKETRTHKILNWSNLVGYIYTIKETDTLVTSNIFVPNIEAQENKALMNELVVRAEQVNKKNSNKQDFKKYYALKNKITFFENIYKMNKEIIGETTFRTNHPLLCRSVSEVIKDMPDGNREILDNKLVNDISCKYEDLINDRIQDDKALSGSEKLCDRYCIIEKDIYYGYCITSHKSQGSNFKIVFVDETDFNKLHDYWNYSIDCKVNVTKEKNQLKYVSYTRPTHIAYGLY